MIPAILRRRRYSLLWLSAIVLLGLLLAWLVSVPLLRGQPIGRSGTLVGQPAPALERGRPRRARLDVGRCG